MSISTVNVIFEGGEPTLDVPGLVLGVGDGDHAGALHRHTHRADRQLAVGLGGVDGGASSGHLLVPGPGPRQLPHQLLLEARPQLGDLPARRAQVRLQLQLPLPQMLHLPLKILIIISKYFFSFRKYF